MKARAIESINGQLVETETITYPSTGRVTKRIYEPGSRVPSDVIVVTQGRHIGNVVIHPMDHREVQMYKTYFKC